ncbi:hypothetical protein [Bordetella avium]|uniref:hypothetical protein n=1 Tax=Bordetella avium TaxID=521 RepID=UPI000E69B43D|nr:hypothetical protein [Bordetella avium]RIQ37165.1 hypothetical protein D0848_13200 [Bordetella avium]RIQ38151.1 hypothetical protein D0847_17560 [Bordetella avium]RIQ39158.1 hypothetical protein D0846_17330 [Bordetella avium]RIQ57749.1 hypothetical protein D0841_13400 [Bordetella avium]RIQ68203.1 hypothetical protein D0836_17360 [Bordetella avium]
MTNQVIPQGWQLPLDLAIDAIENAAPMGQDWPVNWPLVLHGLKELRSALASAPDADGCRHVDTSETSAEPVAWMMAKRERNSDPKFTFADPSCVYQSEYLALYTAPQASPAADARDAKDAARYRWLRSLESFREHDDWTIYDGGGHAARGQSLDAAIDAAIAAQQGKGGE